MTWLKSAINSGLMHRSKRLSYSITSSARASSDGATDPPTSAVQRKALPLSAPLALAANIRPAPGSNNGRLTCVGGPNPATATLGWPPSGKQPSLRLCIFRGPTNAIPCEKVRAHSRTPWAGDVRGGLRSVRRSACWVEHIDVDVSSVSASHDD